METNILFTHLTSAALFGYLMNKAMTWEKIPWINYHTQKLNSILRLALSGLTTLGIHWTWGGTWSTGRQVMIVIPALAVIGHALFQWLGQYAMQHGWERMLDIGRTYKLDPQAFNDLVEAIAVKVAQQQAPKA
jgi:hypothetical protein